MAGDINDQSPALGAFNVLLDCVTGSQAVDFEGGISDTMVYPVTPKKSSHSEGALSRRTMPAAGLY